MGSIETIGDGLCAWVYEPRAADEGGRLDRVLSQAASRTDDKIVRALSREQLKELIAKGRVTRLDGDAVQVINHPAQRVNTQMRLRVEIQRPTPARLEPFEMALDILFEDRDIVVLNKPAHMPVHPGAGVRRTTLVHGLLAHCGDLAGIGGVLRPGVVHRLDADTTGVMVFAKHDLAHRALAQQFAERLVKKHYLALAIDAPVASPIKSEPGCGYQRLKTPFCRHPTERQRFVGRAVRNMVVREATSDIRIIAKQAGLLLVAIALHTGRTHQIRVHLAESVGPVVCDRLYRPAIAQRFKKEGRCRSLDGLDHHALHAAELSLTHPISGVPMTFVAPLPQSWRHVAEQMADGQDIACLAACGTQATVQAG